MTKTILIICIGFLICTKAFSQPKKIPVYPGHYIPLSKLCLHQVIIDTVTGGIPNRISKVEVPELWFYPAVQMGDRGKRAVLVIPGGGYSFVSVENEGRKMGERLSKEGYDVYVLVYRLPMPDCQTDSKWVPLTDAMNSLQMIWDLKYQKVGVIGFSAGGHLASTLSTLIERNPHHLAVEPPNAVCLLYPVVDLEKYKHTGSRKKLLGADTNTKEWVDLFSTHLQVNAKTPKTILIHSSDDIAAPWQNSLLYTEALQKVGVKAEFHLFPVGGHGYGLGSSERKGAPDWVPLMLNFFSEM